MEHDEVTVSEATTATAGSLGYSPDVQWSYSAPTLSDSNGVHDDFSFESLVRRVTDMDRDRLQNRIKNIKYAYTCDFCKRYAFFLTEKPREGDTVMLDNVVTVNDRDFRTGDAVQCQFCDEMLGRLTPSNITRVIREVIMKLWNQ